MALRAHFGHIDQEGIAWSYMWPGWGAEPAEDIFLTDRQLEKLERGLNHSEQPPPSPDEVTRHLRLEEAVSRLRGVRRARVRSLDGAVDVKVLTLPERTQDATIADVHAVAKRLGINPGDVKVTVLGPRPQAAGARRKLSSLSTKRYDQRFSAQVTLELDGDALMGEVDVPAGRRFEFRSVARAVLESVRPLIPCAMQLEQVEVFNFGPERLAVVSISSQDDILIGSALVKGDELDAIARATLDGVNRVLHLDPKRTLRTEPANA